MSEAPAPAAPRIAVVGLAGRFPGAADAAALWRNLAAGVESIDRFAAADAAAEGVPAERLADPAWVRAGGVLDGADRFDAAFFGIGPREAEVMDPQHRLFLECAWNALEDAGRAPGRLAGRVGVFAGAGRPDYLLDHVRPRWGDGGDFATAYAISLGNDRDFLATRLSWKLDLTGPSLTVATACSTSLVAVCLAATGLAAGDCDLALAGGVSLRLPQRGGYPFTPDGILSPDGRCRAFDAEARGTVPGSGVGVVALKRLEDALADGDPIRAVLCGWAVNNDGAGKLGYTAPRAEGQAAAIREALALAGFDPASIGYVEAHGTGTALGDPIEVAALRQAFGDGLAEGSCAIGSLKSNLGHLDTASGVAGLIKAVLAVEHGKVPPSLHFRRPNPRLDLGPFFVADRLREWPRRATEDGRPAPRRAGVSSFGIGGTNAHVAIEQAPAAPARGAAAGPHLVLVSAADAEALERRTAALAGHLAQRPELDPADVAHTLQAGRKPLAVRRAAVVADLADAARLLARPDDPRWLAGRADGGPSPVAFLFPGQGAQQPGVGGELYRRLPVFRRWIDAAREALAAAMEPHAFAALDPLLPGAAAPASDAAAAERLAHTALAQPVLFAVEHALARAWIDLGVEPEAMLGHSVGEWVAATLAGVVSFADGARLVALRGRLMGALPRGAMLAVPLAEERLAALLAEEAPELAVAAVNAPELCAVAGPSAAVERLARRLTADGVAARRLTTSHAFHSPHVEPAVEPFRAAVAAVPLAPPRRPFVSSATGDWITPEEAIDPAWWAGQLRRPVRFSAALAALLAEPRRALVEVGPGSSLTGLVRRQPGGRERLALHGLPRRPGDGGRGGEAEALLGAAARLWLAGVDLDRAALDGDRPRQRVSLPGYPFAGPRYWIERPGAREDGSTKGEGGRSAEPAGEPGFPAEALGARPAASAGDGPSAAGEIVKRGDPGEWLYLPAWRSLPPVEIAAPAPAPANGGPVSWLVFGGGGGVAGALAVRLAAAGARVATAAAGDRFERVGEDRFTVRPGEAADVEALLAAVAAGEAPPRVAWLDPLLDGAVGALDPAALAASLLVLARATSAAAGSEPCLLAAVSDGLWEVAGESVRAPERAAAEGLARVLPQELPGLACRWIDLPPAPLGEADLDLLAAELAVPPPSAPPRVALRGGRRWQEVWEPVNPSPASGAGPRPPRAASSPSSRPASEAREPAGDGRGSIQELREPPTPAPVPSPARPAFRAGGRYLITGGLGRFGQAAARHLAAGHGARLLLLDRRAPDAGLLAALGTAGGEAEAVFGDVADPETVAAALLRAADLWGGLDGVLHAAGLPSTGFRPLAELGRDELAAHLAPKLGGLAALAAGLERLAAERPAAARPAFVLAASSLAPLLGGVGLGAFAAADAAMDAVSAAAPRAGGARWSSVSWEVWEQALGAAGAAIGGQQTALALSLDEVTAALDRAAPLAGLPRLAVAAGDLPARILQWTAPLPPRRRAAAPRPAGAGAASPPAGAVERRIAEVWQEVLGVPAVGRDDDFFLLGGDSLSGLQVLSKLRSELAVELPLQSFFEARTLAGMAAVVAQEERRREGDERRIEALLAEVEGLDDAEVAALLAVDGEAAAGGLA